MKKVLGSLLAAAGLVVVAAAPANAAALSTTQCSSGYYCAWTAEGYSGGFYQANACSGDAKGIPTARSIKNRTSRTVTYLYNGSTVAILNPGEYYSSVPAVNQMRCG